MAHEIWNEKFLAVRVPAWHKVGHLFQEPLPPSEATQFLGFEEPQLVPLHLPDGKPSGYFAVQMGDEIFGAVSDNWEIIPLEPILPLLDQFSQDFPLSAAGQLRKGRLVFFTFESRGELLGEEYLRHMVILHSYEPGRSWKLLYSPTRVVCMNTVIAAESDASWELRIRHQRSDIQLIPEALLKARALALQDLVDRKMEAFAKLGDFDSQLDALLEHVYTLPTPPNERERLRLGEQKAQELHERQSEQVLQVRGLVKTAFQRFNDEFPALGNTGYAALQAVTEIADWRPNQKSKESALLGLRSREKVAAWEYLSAQLV